MPSAGSLGVLRECHLTSVIGYLKLKNIFAVKCVSRFFNQLVCSRRSAFSSKLLFQECMVPYLARIESDPGFLPSALASNMLQWANLQEIPVAWAANTPSTRISQRFLPLHSTLARMMACAHLKETKFASSSEKEDFDRLVARLPFIAEWDNVRYYDAFAANHQKDVTEQMWICQKYGATVSIKIPEGKLDLHLVASHELTEVVEERLVYCSICFPNEAKNTTLLQSQSERWIEEETFTSFPPAVRLEEWKRLQEFLNLESFSLTVALVFRLLSAPVAFWHLDNWRKKKSEGEEGQLARLSFEARPTILWLQDEFAHVTQEGSDDWHGLGTCSLNDIGTLHALEAFLSP